MARARARSSLWAILGFRARSRSRDRLGLV